MKRTLDQDKNDPPFNSLPEELNPVTYIKRRYTQLKLEPLASTPIIRPQAVRAPPPAGGRSAVRPTAEPGRRIRPEPYTATVLGGETGVQLVEGPNKISVKNNALGEPTLVDKDGRDIMLKPIKELVDIACIKDENEHSILIATNRHRYKKVIVVSHIKKDSTGLREYGVGINPQVFKLDSFSLIATTDGVVIVFPDGESIWVNYKEMSVPEDVTQIDLAVAGIYFVRIIYGRTTPTEIVVTEL